MLKIRLTRLGKKNNAFFRLVVAENTAPIKGRFIEAVGFINPHTKEKNLEKERILRWIGKGAKCSDTVHNLLVREGIIKGPKKAIKIKRKAEEKKDENPKAEAKKSKGEEDAAEEKPEEIIEEKKDEIKGGEKIEEPRTEIPKIEEKTEKTSEKKKEEVKKEEKAEEKK
jgi:small subunit ribosomal protein S16